MEFVEDILKQRVPKHRVDFTRMLPRVIVMYMLSFLDPRSLCRCAQVCWYWRYLSDSNELWAPKCVRRGWNILGSVESMQSGTWKKHYIQNIRYLQVSWPMKLAAEEIMQKLDEEQQTARKELQRATQRDKAKLNDQKKQLQVIEEARRAQALQNALPWKGPDKHPLEIRRLNYFDNNLAINPRAMRGQESTLNRQSKSPREPGRESRKTTSNINHDRLTNGAKMSARSADTRHVNMLLTGPRQPWRPNSRYPQKRAEDLDKRHKLDEFREFDEMQRYSDSVRTRAVGRLETGCDVEENKFEDYSREERGRNSVEMQKKEDDVIRMMPRVSIDASGVDVELMPPPPAYSTHWVQEEPTVPSQTRPSTSSSDPARSTECVSHEFDRNTPEPKPRANVSQLVPTDDEDSFEGDQTVQNRRDSSEDSSKSTGSAQVAEFPS